MQDEMRFSGPHVSAALLCERILIEKDNVPTFVRIVERFTLPRFSGKIPPSVQMPPQTIQFMLVVAFKAGDMGAGSYTLTIRLRKPDMSYASPDNIQSVVFNGSDDNGAMSVTPIFLANPEEGLHWFEAIFEGSPIARIPLRILYQQTNLQLPMLPTPPENH